MHQVAKLQHLKVLNLAENCLTSMEGLKDLKLLTWLSLAGNKIEVMDSLSRNVHLEHLDLSDNRLTRVSDLSYLKNLKARRDLPMIFILIYLTTTTTALKLWGVFPPPPIFYTIHPPVLHHIARNHVAYKLQAMHKIGLLRQCK